MAMGFPIIPSFAGSGEWEDSAASRSGDRIATSAQASGDALQPQQAGFVSYLAALLRHTFAREWHGYSTSTGFTRTSARNHYADIHARDAQAGSRCAQSLGCVRKEVFHPSPSAHPQNQTRAGVKWPATSIQNRNTVTKPKTKGILQFLRRNRNLPCYFSKRL